MRGQVTSDIHTEIIDACNAQNALVGGEEGCIKKHSKVNKLYQSQAIFDFIIRNYII